MPYKRRSGFNKSLVSFAKWIGIAAPVVLTIVAINLLVRSYLSSENAVSQKAPIKLALAAIQEPGDASSEISGKYFGLCKKKSIHSVDDFRRTVRDDAVLSAYFSGFNWEAANLGKQDKDIWTFVSYRKGDAIRMTSKPVMLPKGDGYVTDGTRVVRTYCCNDYVIAPPPMEVSMASPADPVERVDGPPRRMNNDFNPVNNPSHQLSSESPAEDPAAAISESLGKVPDYSVSSPAYGGHGYLPYSSAGIKQETTPIVTPEPGSFFLAGAGLTVFGLFRLLRRKRTKLH